MAFIGELVVKPLPPKVIKTKLFGIIPYKKTILEWIVYEEFGYNDERLDVTVIVPAGSTTDFASIPRAFWSILPPWGRYGWAAVIHDYLYRHGLYTRAIADLIFLHAMEELHVAKWKRVTMFNAVRWFGASAYHDQSD